MARLYFLLLSLKDLLRIRRPHNYLLSYVNAIYYMQFVCAIVMINHVLQNVWMALSDAKMILRRWPEPKPSPSASRRGDGDGEFSVSHASSLRADA
jgi:hypothetical protein